MVFIAVWVTLRAVATTIWARLMGKLAITSSLFFAVTTVANMPAEERIIILNNYRLVICVKNVKRC